MAKGMNVAPSEYRGVGVQVSRLDNQAKKGCGGGSGDTAGNALMTTFLVKGATSKASGSGGGGRKGNWGSRSGGGSGSRNGNCGSNDEDNKNFISREQSNNSVVMSKNISDDLARVNETERSVKVNVKNDKTIENCNRRTLDIDVLRALPDEIRDQIIDEYRQQGFVIPTISRFSDKSSRSTKTNPSVVIETRNTEKRENKTIYTDPQPSTSGYCNNIDQALDTLEPYREQHCSGSSASTIVKPDDDLDAKVQGVTTPTDEQSQDDLVNSFSQVS